MGPMVILLRPTADCDAVIPDGFMLGAVRDRRSGANRGECIGIPRWSTAKLRCVDQVGLRSDLRSRTAPSMTLALLQRTEVEWRLAMMGRLLVCRGDTEEHRLAER